MMEGSSPESIWLAAEYHFPSVYSCRVPMNSMSSAYAMPGPGPATVRLALIRTGIELFGYKYTQDNLFPFIRSASIYIRPPERVAFSTQQLRILKASSPHRLDESIGYREMAHANGTLTIYVEVSHKSAGMFRELLMGIGYWGQATSLAQCISCKQAIPQIEACALPLRSLDGTQPIEKFISGLVTEFRDATVEWEDIMPHSQLHQTEAITLELYLWPMVLTKQNSSGRLLVRKLIRSPISSTPT